MARYQLILAYDGTQFRGFQRQAGDRTVQDVIEAALRELGWEGRAILYAGRTDSGVHASGQVIAFDLAWQHTSDDLRAALNARLPQSVAAREVLEARPDFHPRYDARARRYQYRLFCQESRSPLRERFAWRVWPQAAIERMQSVAACLVGTHDFAAFGSSPRAGGSTVRTVLSAGWRSVDVLFEGPDLVFEIVANAFLYRMVRRLVKLQVAIGQGWLEASAMQKYLESPGGEMVQGIAPANGLTLAEVWYEPLSASQASGAELE
jgi:tRNA pseudouridine38-40 synthase